MIDKEKALKILNVNCLQKEDGKEKLASLLKKTKWFKGKELTFENMQKVYDMVHEKYNYSAGTMMRTKVSWSATVQKIESKPEENYFKAIWIDTVYAYDLEELMYKILLLLYFSIVEGVKFKDAEAKVITGVNGTKK